MDEGENMISDGVILMCWGFGLGSGILFVAVERPEILPVSMIFVLCAVGFRIWNWFKKTFLGV